MEITAAQARRRDRREPRPTMKSKAARQRDGLRALRLVLLGCLLVLGGLTVALFASSARAADPLSWTSPLLVDHEVPFEEQPSLYGVSCPTAGLCAAIDSEGDILTSADAGTGGAGSWTTARVDPTGSPTTAAIACPSSSLCVAVRNHDVLTSTDPTGGSGTWKVATVGIASASSWWLSAISCPTMSLCVATGDGDIIASADPTAGAGSWTVANVGKYIKTISCPTEHLCVAMTYEGDVITSTDPTGGSGAWTATSTVDPANESPINSVSCPTESLCVGGDQSGDIVTSTNPTGGASAWTLDKSVTGEPGIDAISCPSASSCVATTGKGTILTSTNPTGGSGAWSETTTVDNAFFSSSYLSCPSTSFCAAVDDVRNAFVSTEPTNGASAWHESAGIDSAGTDRLASISCASTALCVAVEGAGGAGGSEGQEDAQGRIVTSTDPFAEPASWTAGQGPTANADVFNVSCATTTFCAAVDYHDSAILTSTNPSAGASSWASAVIGGFPSIISCPSASFCAAAGYLYEPSFKRAVWTSTEPTTGASAWHATALPTNNEVPSLTAISCVSSSLCVAVSWEGSIVTSSDPAGGSATWDVLDTGSRNVFSSVSCPSATLCVASDYEGEVFVSTDPTAGLWTSRPIAVQGLHTTGINDVSCTAAALCVAVTSEGEAIVSTEPVQGPWTTVPIDADYALTGVSCVTSGVCMAIDRGGDTIGGASGTSGAMPHAGSRPTISGSATVGQTLTEAHAAWSNGPTNYTYQWEACEPNGSECHPIAGATAQTYTPVPGDIASIIRVQEIASNNAGVGAPATSAPTAKVEPPVEGEEEASGSETEKPGNSTPPPSGGQALTTTRVVQPGGSEQPSTVVASTSQLRAWLASLKPSGKDATIPVILKHGGYAMAFKALEAGSLSVQWFVMAHGAHLAKSRSNRAVLVASGRVRLSGAGRSSTVLLKLTPLGKRLLRHAKRLKIEAKERFVPPHGTSVQAEAGAVFKR